MSKTLDKHQLQHLLKQISHDELLGWVLQYAEESDECCSRLRGWLQHRLLESSPTYESARETIRNIFHAPGAVVRESNPRRWNRDWRTHWEQVLPELDMVLKQAESWVKADKAEAALGAALQTLAELAETVDAEVHHGYVSGVYECAEQVQNLIRTAVRARSLSPDCLSVMLMELRALAVAPNLAGDGLELTSLFLWCCERCLKQEGTLGMLDSLMDDPANAGDWQKLHLLERRMELLRKWGREEEISPLIRQYLYIPAVRRREVERLMQARQWKAALQLVELGLRLAKNSHEVACSEQWNELKIKLLKKLNKPADA